MPDRRDEESLTRFITSAFRSIWSLELLLIVRQRPDHHWSREELIGALRASDQVLAGGVADLIGAELVAAEGETIHYAPAAPILDETVADVAALYAKRPAKVRRMIVGGVEDDLARFAGAFRLRGEKE